MAVCFDLLLIYIIAAAAAVVVLCLYCDRSDLALVMNSYGYPLLFYEIPELIPNLAIAYGVSPASVSVPNGAAQCSQLIAMPLPSHSVLTVDESLPADGLTYMCHVSCVESLMLFVKGVLRTTIPRILLFLQNCGGLCSCWCYSYSRKSFDASDRR